MHLSSLDILVFCILVCGFFAILIYRIFKKQAFSASWVQYLLMGRQLTLPLFVITLVSSWYGSLIGTVQIAYNFGLYNFIVSGCVWYISAALFAVFIAGRLNKTHALNLGQIIEERAGREFGLCFSILLYLKHLPIAYAIALAIFLSNLLEFGYELALIISLSMAVLLALFGGVRAAVLLNFAQFILMFSSMLAIVAICSMRYGGLDFLESNLPAAHLSSSGGNSISKIILWLVIAVSGTLFSPIFHERCLAASSPNIARLGIFISMVFWVCSDILTTSVGLYARAILGDNITADALIAVIMTVLPEGLKGFCLAALLITCISAMDAYFIAAISVPAHLLAKYNQRSQKWLRSAIICLTAVLTFFTSLLFNQNIENAWLYFESIFISVMVAPTLILLLGKGEVSNKILGYSMLSTVVFMSFYELHNLRANESGFLVGIVFNTLLIMLMYFGRKIYGTIRQAAKVGA